jgi:hypothetical protein
VIYPNPDDVVYPTTQPPKFAGQLTDRRSGRLFPIHNHIAFVDANGDGVTDVVASHFHRIRGGRVLPDASDSHEHVLTGLPAGAG